ncbi:MAG: 50S ribosomal protein L11 methyltransferase, partial [Myxococcales bacterium]|nr:50S ribosomal protein L11 methyltransferase [Myxococcales bacterium]
MALFSLRIVTLEPELTSLELFELGAQGIEERDHADGAELVLYSESESELRELVQGVEASRVSRYRILPEKDGWETAWAQHLEPIELCKGFWVKPTTAHAHGPANAQLIHIEPDLAFGIGSHATTQLAARSLLATWKDAKRVLDVGTGTGVLCFMARLLGAERVVGLEIDPRALRSAQKNLGLNRRCAPIEFSATPLGEFHEADWDIVIANIETTVLLQLADDLVRVSGKHLILTGILAEQLSEVLRAFESRGMRPTTIRDRDDWRLVSLT